MMGILEFLVIDAPSGVGASYRALQGLVFDKGNYLSTQIRFPLEKIIRNLIFTYLSNPYLFLQFFRLHHQALYQFPCPHFLPAHPMHH